MQADDLYVALPGERVDGHDFLDAAIAAGASVLLASRDVESALRKAAAEAGCAIVRVADTFQAVTDLAAAWRGMLSGRVLVLTGSSGKTTTKNLVRDVLAAHGSVVATEGNQNNELGVPATVLRADASTPAVVVEIGMRGSGQIESLCSFVKPDMALVTNVGESHIELLGSRDNIARAKAEAVAAVPQGTGIAFINASDDYARQLSAYGRAEERGVRVVWFDGSGADPASYPADQQPAVYASQVHLDEASRPAFTLNLPGDSARCQLQLRGMHNVHNAVAAAAVGCAMGMDAATIAEALNASMPMSGRQQVHVTAAGVTVVDDAYNANPDSMRASLSMFAGMDVPGRRFAVLGDMGELGAHAPACHREVGRAAAHADVDRLICIGELAQGIAAGARADGMPEYAIDEVANVDAALALLQEELDAGDAVLVKASHSMGLERVVEGLVD